jgi:hypothetical protein
MSNQPNNAFKYKNTPLFCFSILKSNPENKMIVSIFFLLSVFLCIVNSKKVSYRILRAVIDNDDSDRLFGKRISFVDVLYILPNIIDGRAIEARSLIQLRDFVRQERLAKDEMILKQF